jgi:uncharacterized protein (TIGR02271 family)
MATYTRHAVVGYFKDDRSAREAFEDLLEHGFSKEMVHLSSSSDYSTDAATGGAGLTGRAPSEMHGGGITGWFRSLFGSDEYETDASRYSERARSGGSVVAVDATDQTRDQAVQIMNQHGATDIDENGTAPAAEMRAPSATATNREKERTIPVVREDIEIGKRPVQSGGVRVYSKTLSEPVEEQVRLRQERVTVERQPTDRPVTGQDDIAWRDETIDVLEVSEEPVVEKRARVVEEVRVGKEATERTETVRDTVRRTEVRAEPIGPTTGTRPASDYSSAYQRDFQARYAASGADYQTYAPAYEYGSTMASDPRYEGKTWQDVEPTLQSDFARRYPQSSWERMKDAVHYGWEKITGKRNT